jgi:streptogramin lyase
MQVAYIAGMIRCGQLRLRLLALVCVAITAPLLGGCGSSVSAVQRGEPFTGRVRAGQHPVAGAAMELDAAGSAGNGAGSLNLLNTPVTTDSRGRFNIAHDYVCPAATTQVYLVTRGGDPGLGVTNPALAMVAALGNCGDLRNSADVVVNEVTTVAAAWALAPFLSTGGIVGASPTNATGLRNAFASAKNLADTASGTAPGSALPTGAVTESAKLYTLANALAACVNSNGGSACSALFSAAAVGGTAPATTLDAAMNIVRQPGTNVAAVFHAARAQGPFQPALSTSPNDWTMSVTYGGCASGCGGLNLPGSVAIDSGGNVLIANFFGGVVSEFSPAGVPVSANGIAGTGLRASYGVAVDGSDNVWVTNEQSVTGANNHHSGSVSEFTSTGVERSGYGYTGGGVYYPLAVAVAPNGEIWVADHSASSATLLAADGSPISGGGGYARSALPFTTAVATDANSDGWFAVENAAVRVTPAGVVTSFNCCDGPAGIAVDAAGNVWVADYMASKIVELTAAGAVAHRTSILQGNGGPQGIAVDGAGNVWTANYYGNVLVELAGSTAGVVSPAVGYGLDARLSEPYGLAIDASGGVWISNAYTNTLTQFVGLASPVRTPMLGPPVQP